MNDGSAAMPLSLGSDTNPNLSSNVIGACLRSAFIEALYDDCADLLPEAAFAAEPGRSPAVPAE